MHGRVHLCFQISHFAAFTITIRTDTLRGDTHHQQRQKHIYVGFDGDFLLSMIDAELIDARNEVRARTGGSCEDMNWSITGDSTQQAGMVQE